MVSLGKSKVVVDVTGGKIKGKVGSKGRLTHHLGDPLRRAAGRGRVAGRRRRRSSRGEGRRSARRTARAASSAAPA